MSEALKIDLRDEFEQWVKRWPQLDLNLTRDVDSYTTRVTHIAHLAFVAGRCPPPILFAQTRPKK